MEITKELCSCMRKFQNEFGDIVPLRELPEGTTEETLIKAIKVSLDNKQNCLPEIFGYAEMEKDSTVII